MAISFYILDEQLFIEQVVFLIPKRVVDSSMTMHLYHNLISQMMNAQFECGVRKT